MTTPSVDQALAWLRSGHIQPGDDMLPPQVAAELQAARQVRACFRQFPEVLDMILTATLARPPVDYRLSVDSGQFQTFALQRQGQNQVAALLLDMIERADEHDRRRDELSADAAERMGAQGLGAGDGGWDGLALR